LTADPTPPTSLPVVIDTFCGAGGLSLGLRQAGLDVRGAFDSDARAAETYRRNLGNHVVVARAEVIRGSDLRALAAVEAHESLIVVGGPPCQGFSRQRRGDDADRRNDLIFEFVRLVLELEPEMFLMENVSTLAGRRGALYLRQFKDRCERAGYHVQWKVLDAVDYGVPQYRRRAFIVGERADGASYFAFPLPTERRVLVREAIGDLPTPQSGDHTAVANHEPDRISGLNRLRISHVPPGGGRADIPPELRLPCHRAGVDQIGHRSVYGRLHWDEPAGTITTKCNSFTRGRFAHPEADRNITMREAARLQSFPDDFVFVGDKVAVAHQIGNAVPPRLARRLGGALLDALRKRAAGEPTSDKAQLALALR